MKVVWPIDRVFEPRFLILKFQVVLRIHAKAEQMAAPLPLEGGSVEPAYSFRDPSGARGIVSPVPGPLSGRQQLAVKIKFAGFNLW